jgi:hypothetical protein
LRRAITGRSRVGTYVGDLGRWPGQVAAPGEKDGVPGKAAIRINFADFTGRWMFHCHIATHEDNGMMSFINVVRPPPGFNQGLIVPPAY